ncbi:MAG: hypothetical protein WC390_09170 [Sulfurimonas sp.]|jgi:hypothetical protein
MERLSMKQMKAKLEEVIIYIASTRREDIESNRAILKQILYTLKKSCIKAK